MADRSFADLFCARFRCAPSSYERKALSACLYWHARLIVPWLRFLMPGFCAGDLEFIRSLGQATNYDEAQSEVLFFQENNMRDQNVVRATLRLRISSRKARRLARDTFRAAAA
jgi:hypothetical protein